MLHELSEAPLHQLAGRTGRCSDWAARRVTHWICIALVGRCWWPCSRGSQIKCQQPGTHAFNQVFSTEGPMQLTVHRRGERHVCPTLCAQVRQAAVVGFLKLKSGAPEVWTPSVPDCSASWPVLGPYCGFHQTERRAEGSRQVVRAAGASLLLGLKPSFLASWPCSHLK